MDIKLRYKSLTVWEKVWSARRSRTDTTESVVPDSMPDILRILDADAMVFLREKSVETDRLILSGEIGGTVLFLGEDADRVQKLELRMPFDWAEAGEGIQPGDRAVVRIRVMKAEARALNPRKISLQVESSAVMEVFRETEIEYPVGAESEELELLQQETQFPYTAGVSEKGFTVAEELALPAARPILEKLLWHHWEAYSEDTKPVGGKMILQGRVELEIGYLGEGEDAPLMERFSVPFSQIMDIPEGVDGSIRTVLQPGAGYVESLPGAFGSGSVHMEIHITAQSVFQSEVKTTCLTDAYSVRRPFSAAQKIIRFSGEAKPTAVRDTVRLRVDTQDSPSELVWGYVRSGTPFFEEETILLPLSVHALYRTQRGSLSSVTEQTSARIPSGGVKGEGAVICSVQLGDPHLSPSGDGFELRMSAEIVCSGNKTDSVCCLDRIEIGEDSDTSGLDAPSLMVVRWGDESLWELAKQFSSTRELISAANPEPAQGQLLLIPRAR